MTAQDALELLQKGGALAAAVLALWAVFTRKVITRGEFDRLDERAKLLEQLNNDANAELRKQSSTAGRLVELAMQQRNESEAIRRESGNVS